MELKSLNLCINWTAEQYKVFEHAIAVYDNETDPDRWLSIAKLVGRTNEEEVKRQYQILVEDIKCIESDKVPLPKYVKNEARSSKRNDMAKEEDRLKKLNLQ